MGNVSKTVFVVDDDELILRMSERIFQAQRYMVRTFMSARECLAAMASQVPDCIVSDLQMPEMDGAQLIEALRARGLAVPVIIVTAAIGSSIQLDQARRAGAYRILSKPHYLKEVFDTIAEVLAGAGRADAAPGWDTSAIQARQDEPSPQR